MKVLVAKRTYQMSRKKYEELLEIAKSRCHGEFTPLKKITMRNFEMINVLVLHS